MAYSIKPTYEPMTFQEMLQPYAVYGTERDRQEEAYMKLLEDARSLEDLKDSEVDKEEYNRYVDFKNRINSMVDEIATTGLSRQTRSNLSKYRAEYQTGFADMVDRIKRRGELVRQQREYLSKNPNAFFDVDYSETPASKVVEGSSYTPYDMNQAASKSATDMYNLYASKGKDVTEEDIATVAENIRRSYDYDSLDDNKKAMVDSAITSGGMSAYKAYSDYVYKNALDQAKLAKAQADAYKSAYGRYKATGERVNRGSGGSSGVVSGGTDVGSGYTGKFEKHMFPNDYGIAVTMTPTKDANGKKAYTYKGIDGKTYMITKEDYDRQFKTTDRQGEWNVEFANRALGGMPQERKIYGNKMTVFVGSDGSVTKVKNNKGSIVDTEGSSNVDIYKAYTGRKDLPKVMTLGQDAYDNLYTSSGNVYSKPYGYEGTKEEYIAATRNGDELDRDIIKSYDDYSEKLKKYDSSGAYASVLSKLNKYVNRITGAKNNDEVMDKLKEVFKLGYHIEVVFYGNPRNNKFKQFELVLTRDENDATYENNSNDNQQQQQQQQSAPQQVQQSRRSQTDSTEESANTPQPQIDTNEVFNGSVIID